MKLKLMALVSIVGYVSCVLLSNILSLKIININNIVTDGGTLLYPFTFTLRDMIHKSLGRMIARKVIILSAFATLFMALMFQLMIYIPADSSWTIQNEFAVILGPVWRLVFASIIAMVISELIDTEAYQFFVDNITKKHQWGRVLFSNTFSIPIDSLAFSFIAFYGTMPIEVVWGIVLSNILIKGAVTLFSLPSIYLVKEEE